MIDAAILALVGGVLSELSFHPRAIDAKSSGPSVLLSLVYFGLLWSGVGGGQTLGMRFLGLRVVGQDGRPISFGTALLQWLGLVLSFAALFIGVIWSRSTRRSRAGTTRSPAPMWFMCNESGQGAG